MTGDALTGPSVHLSPEHDALRHRIRAFLDDVVVPVAPGWEEARGVPREGWRAFADEGLLGLHHDPAVGGGGNDLFGSVVFLEELGRAGFGGVRAAVSVHAYMATFYLARSGTDEQKARWLAPAVLGRRIAALALTEQGAGSDLAAVATTAEPDGEGGLVLHGEKTMVTNGEVADLVVVLARSTPRTRSGAGAAGLSLVVVETGATGLVVTPQPTVGWRAAGTCRVRFDGLRVGADHVLGRPGSGFVALMRGLQLERLVAATLAVGGACASLERLREHLAGRPMFGGRLADRGAVRHRYAELATRLLAVRQAVHHTAWLTTHASTTPVRECSMVKLAATELEHDVADEAMQLHGSAGFVETSAVARAYRDARAGTMAAGSSEVMRDIVAAEDLDG